MKRHLGDGEHVPGETGEGFGERDFKVLGIGVEFVTQQFAESVDWSFSESDHKVLVWRGGQASSKEVEFEGGFAGRVAPRTSNVWVIPAELRSVALAREAECRFVQLTLPTAMIGRDTLRPSAGQQDPLLHHMIERIISVEERDDVAARLLQETLADGLRLHVRDRYGEAAPQSPPPRRVRELSGDEQRCLVEFIRDGADSEVTLQSLAGLVGMKLDVFRRAFERAFHMTPYQFVLHQRIIEAKLLLESAPLSITEISSAVGFSTPSHFATTFKQRVGVTPTTYRQATWGSREL
ncbi:helix-turn-helix transcriptional regulator [Mycolicibacterium peregrinum]|uniref:helix-turn-helix transcriptional regulator n=1 Tax=Mycolicibacterium peregrinum TaxID=43304 RepID=UPI000B327B77|nr:AraC family transcriptional regulator [Mycolicibacterium peregrinum]